LRWERENNIVSSCQTYWSLSQRWLHK